jgi:hypothetical protein
MLLGLWTQPRPAGAELPLLVEMALATGGKPGSQVCVLSSDLWAQTLPLPVTKTVGMPLPEIAAALNFEAEALSGLSAFESAVGCVPLSSTNGENTYWLVQGRTADRDQAEEIIRKAGGRLAGIVHPGGLPRPLDAEAATKSWQRLELWPDAVFCLHGEPGQSVRLQVLNADPQMGRWHADWAKWQQENGPVAHTEMLVGPGLEVPSGQDHGKLFWLDNEAALTAWLLAWAEPLTRKELTLPVLQPVPRPLSATQHGLIAAALAVLVAGACLGHYVWLDRRIQDTQTELQALQGPAQRLAEIQKQVKEQEKKRDEIHSHKEQMERQAQRLLVQRRRLAQLLRVLAEVKSEDLLLQKLETDPTGEPSIHGVCLQPELADQFARSLAEALRDFGWEVQPPKKQAQNLTAGGGPWSFEIQCKGVWNEADRKTSIKPTPRK